MVFLSIFFLLADVLIASLRLGELPDCVSRCWYINRYLHYALLLSAALLMLPAMLMVTPDNFQCLAFIACAALVFVATAPSYFDKSQKMVHSVSAGLCAACAVAWAACVCPIAMLGLCVALIGIADPERRLLWGELGCFATAYLGVI